MKTARKYTHLRTYSTKGFTLVELLVVIAIIAILAAVVVLVINPVELQKRGRDATRLSDLATLSNAITVALQENAETADFLCGGTAGGCGPLNSITGQGGTTKASAADGTGWVMVDLAGQQAVKVGALPVDPTNGTCGTATCQYQYQSDGTDWEINAYLESVEHSPKMLNDGGDSTTQYETGSKLTLMN